MLHTKYQGSRPFGFRQEALWFQTRRFFHVSPYISLCNTCDPPGQGQVWPQGHNLNKLGREHKVMLHTKCQGSRPYGLRQEGFFHVSPYISLCNTCDPPGQGQFWPQGHNLNKLGREHKVMLHTKCQGSRPYGFRQEGFFMFFPI